MADPNLLSRCGIYCGACYVYRAERDVGEFLREVAQWQEVEIDEVKCNGCTAPINEKWPSCQNCYPINCQKEKNLAYCHECGDFWDGKCNQYTKFEEFISQRGEKIRLNLIKISADPDLYLKEQESKWSCMKCGGSYSWYEETCHHCGKNLNRRNMIKHLPASLGIP